MATATGYSQDLAVSICEDLLAKLHKLGSEILTKIGWIKLTEGKERYKHFKDNGFKWLEEDYEHEGFRAVYCERLFVTRAEITCYILSIFESKGWLPNLLYDTTYKSRTLRVASFGCGPGSDLAGFEAFYSNMKVRYSQSLQAEKPSMSESHYSRVLKCIQEAKIESILGYDSAKGWSSYLEVLGYSFCHQVIDHQFVIQMAPVDIVILSYFAHNAHFSMPLDPTQRILTVDGEKDSVRNWDILMQKSKLIIVLDTKGCMAPIFSLLRKRGFGAIVGMHDSNGREVAVHLWYRMDLWT